MVLLRFYHTSYIREQPTTGDNFGHAALLAEWRRGNIWQGVASYQAKKNVSGFVQNEVPIVKKNWESVFFRWAPGHYQVNWRKHSWSALNLIALEKPISICLPTFIFFSLSVFPWPLSGPSRYPQLGAFPLTHPCTSVRILQFSPSSQIHADTSTSSCDDFGGTWYRLSLNFYTKNTEFRKGFEELFHSEAKLVRVFFVRISVVWLDHILCWISQRKNPGPVDRLRFETWLAWIIV